MLAGRTPETVDGDWRAKLATALAVFAVGLGCGKNLKRLGSKKFLLKHQAPEIGKVALYQHCVEVGCF